MRQADNDLSIPDQRRQAKGYCAKEVRIMGSKSVLLRTLVAASSAKPAMFGVYPSGAPEEIRTPDPQIRSLVLYPAELRARFSLGILGLTARQHPTKVDGRERAL